MGVNLHNRLRLMRGATALLYLGPLLAGLGGFGWRIVPVFVAIFLLWTLILRPATWPQTAPDWLRPDLLIRLLGQSLIQVLLVVVCFGIGRGLGGVTGFLPPFPVLLPIAISMLAIPLCRLIWNPDQAEAMDRFLDTAIGAITAASADMPPDRSDAQTLAARLLAPLQALHDATTDHNILRHLDAITPHADPADLVAVLLGAARSGTASRTGLQALVLLVTDLRHGGRFAGAGYQTRTFMAIAGEPDLVLLYARRSMAQLDGDPAVWGDSVAPETLRLHAAHTRPDAGAALLDLAARTERATAPDSATPPERATPPDSATPPDPATLPAQKTPPALMTTPDRPPAPPDPAPPDPARSSPAAAEAPV